MQKIEEFKNNRSLCEIYITGFQLAFLSDTFEQAHQWVLCKDFMTDVLWATVNQESVEIYDFCYEPDSYPRISTDPVRIVVRNKELENNEFDRQIQKSYEFLHILETRLKFELASIEKVEHPDGGAVWMFTVDKKWIHASPLFSMLSLFLRVGCYYDGGGKLNDAIRKFRTVEHNDAEYLEESRNMRLLIMKKGLSIFAPKMKDNYPHEDVDTIHDCWGIVESKSCHTFKTLWDLKGLKKTKKKVGTK